MVINQLNRGSILLLENNGEYTLHLSAHEQDIHNKHILYMTWNGEHPLRIFQTNMVDKNTNIFSDNKPSHANARVTLLVIIQRRKF